MIVVPNQLKSIIMRTYHESAMAGHLGFIKTLRRIKDKYFWTGMSRDVQKYCEEFKCCHARKNPSRRRRHELGRRPAVWAPFQSWKANGAGGAGKGVEQQAAKTKEAEELDGGEGGEAWEEEREEAEEGVDSISRSSLLGSDEDGGGGGGKEVVVEVGDSSSSSDSDDSGEDTRPRKAARRKR